MSARVKSSKGKSRFYNLKQSLEPRLLYDASAGLVLAAVNAEADPAPAPDAISVMGSVSSSNGGTIVITAVDATTQVAGASVTVDTVNNQLLYTPAPGFSGADTFNYTVNDGTGPDATGVVSLTVNPVANPDIQLTVAQSPIYFNELNPANGLVIGTDLTIFSYTQGQNGSVILNPDGSFVYTPNTGFSGVDTFTYIAKDGSNLMTGSTPVMITVLPVGVPDKVIALSGISFDGNVLSNDIGTAPLTIVLNSAPSNGELIMNPDGSFTYTPNTGFIGIDRFLYTAQDSSNLPAKMALLQVQSDLAASDAALAIGDIQSSENHLNAAAAAASSYVPGSENLTRNQILHQAGAVMAAQANQANQLSLSLLRGDYITPIQIATINGTAIAVDINVVGAMANPDTGLLTQADVPLVSGPAQNLLANDFGEGLMIEGAAMDSPTVESTDRGGLVSINMDGSFVYTPAANFSGIDTFTYQALDINGFVTNMATVTVSVSPVANPDIFVTAADNIGTGVPVIFNVITNSDGGDIGSELAVTLFTDPTDGNLVLNADGSFTYTPNNNFSGIDTFDYTITDSDGLTASATVTVNVMPVAIDPFAVTNAGIPAGDPINDNVTSYDIGTGIHVQLVGFGTSHGTLDFTSDSGLFTYTPNSGFSGTDSFIYRGADASGLLLINADEQVAYKVDFELASAQIAVDANDSVGAIEHLDRARESAYRVTASIDRDALISRLGQAQDVLAAGNLMQARVELAFARVALSNLSGGVLAPGNIRFNIEVNPTALSDTGYTTPAESLLDGTSLPGLLLNDIGSGQLSIASSMMSGFHMGLDGLLHTTTAHGGDVAIIDPLLGTFSYTPLADGNFSGIDTFNYAVVDGNGLVSNMATVSIDVTPVAVNDAFEMNQNASLTASLTGNDVGLPTGDLHIISGSVIAPAHGTVVVNADNTFTYTPTIGFVGNDSFKYAVNGDGGNSNLATVTIKVDPITIPIHANVDNYQTNAQEKRETPYVVDAAHGVLANDQGMGTLLVTPKSNLTTAKGGTVTIKADGSFSYRPKPDFSGLDSFTYTMTDSTGQIVSSVANIKVVPVAVTDNFTIKNSKVLHGSSILDNDIGSGLKLVQGSIVKSAGFKGSLTVAKNGSFVFDPIDGFVGNQSFTYTAIDKNGLKVVGTVNLNVVADRDRGRDCGRDMDFKNSVAQLMAAFGCA